MKALLFCYCFMWLVVWCTITFAAGFKIRNFLFGFIAGIFWPVTFGKLIWYVNHK